MAKAPETTKPAVTEVPETQESESAKARKKAAEEARIKSQVKVQPAKTTK